MTRPFKVLLAMSALTAVAAFVSACGTEKISVPQSQTTQHRGAMLFSQRCSGCHTLSYAGTQGSASNPRTAEVTNGPNLDQRCERPVTRVLYAIQNGGFSGAVMPQNVVVGQDAVDVAQFVSKYAGTKAAKSPGTAPCDSEPVGTLPPPQSAAASNTSSTSTKSTASATSTLPTGGATGTHKKASAKAKAQGKKTQAQQKK